MKLLYAIVLVGATALASDVRTDQYAVLTFSLHDACVHIAPDARLEVPLHDDGTPDYTKGKLAGISVDKDGACGHYEVRKRLK